MSYTRTALVTGANKGIGLAIVRNLALQYPSSAFNNGPLLIYLSARDQKRGEDAVESLRQDSQLKKAKALGEHGGLSTIKYHGMDISKPESIRDMASFLEKEHPDGIDIVVNNAGIAMDGFDSNVVQQTLQCNYYGTLDATQAFLPLIRSGGRLVNVASMAGSLNNKYSDSLRKKFASTQTVSDVTKLMEAFSNGIQQGNHEKEGWPSAAYAVSKTGVIGMTRAIAKDEERKGSGVLINSCCPGYVNTDMTKGKGVKTVDQGAETPVLLALGDLQGKSGEYWSKMKVAEW